MNSDEKEHDKMLAAIARSQACRFCGLHEFTQVTCVVAVSFMFVMDWLQTRKEAASLLLGLLQL